MKKADVGVALYLLAAVIFFIVPIPPLLLSAMQAVNIALGLIIMFNALFAREVLDMSFFPTLLLFTTIFRISLNVSSTRAILTSGDPGNVVRVFGSFVGGNDLIIGAIVFIILIIIQFVVINKGSERVAEVTARFTLDAMPGKQMAIDADLNTGIISEKEARERRDKIQAESSFFGTMDGANVEIVEEVGLENAFIFGLKSDEVIRFENHGGYNPMDIYNTDADIKKVVDQLVDGTYASDKELFRSLYNSLLNTLDTDRADRYFILKDFRSYAEAHKRVEKAYKDTSSWAKSAMLNVAKVGKFTSDRTIQEYVDEIWHLDKVEL